MATDTIEIQKAFRVSQRVKLECKEDLTEQAHKNETDMNYILRDYARTGFIKHSKENQGRYDDVSVQDFQDAMYIVTEAKNMFNELPAMVRNRFAHDPAQFLEFVQNPDNKAEMQKMGILQGNDGLDLSGVPTSAPISEADIQPATETTTETTVE